MSNFKRQNRFWVMPFVILMLLASQVSFADNNMLARVWEEGRHYKKLAYPIKTADPSKIEVLEVFWYGCPHCYEFNNAHLKDWEKNLPEDVDFRLMPATFPGWVEHAKAYYAMEFLGAYDVMHQHLFDKIVAKPKKYKDIDDIKPLFIEKGIKEEDFDKLFKASGFRKISKVDEAIKKAQDTIKKLRISGVPALIVNGKYRVGVREAGGLGNMLKVANYLVHQERQAKKK